MLCNVSLVLQDKAPPPPPPTDMQLGAGRPPMMPLSNAATAGIPSAQNSKSFFTLLVGNSNTNYGQN